MLNTTPAAPNFADTLMAARVTDWLANDPRKRALREASDKAAAENGASTQRVDRHTLGLRIVTPRA